MFEGHDVVMASWYAHGWRGWLQLGSRISVIDWTDEGRGRPATGTCCSRPRKRFLWFHRLRPVRVHAGGIVWYGEHLFVAGSSSGVRVFRLDDIVRVRNRLRTKGYRYVLPQYSFYAAEHDEGGDRMTYSFMSLDRAGAEDHLVGGGVRPQGRQPPADPLRRSTATPSCCGATTVAGPCATELHDRQIARMQGAVVVDGTWVITSSNGEGNPGDLWVGTPATTPGIEVSCRPGPRTSPTFPSAAGCGRSPSGRAAAGSTRSTPTAGWLAETTRPDGAAALGCGA